MKANREAAISETLKWEGGYTNHPSDPGGPTNWGITIWDARKYWKKDADSLDVKNMPKSVAIDIYRNKYWTTKYYDCDNLPSGVDLFVFDFGVNSGPARSKDHLDKAGKGTPTEIINRLYNSRMAFLRRLKTWPTFGTGWTNRCNGIKKKSLSMASSKTTDVVIGTTTASGAATGTAVAVNNGVDWTTIAMYGVTALAVIGVGYWVYRKWFKNV